MLSNSKCTVSYTHLDVYKRQLLCRNTGIGITVDAGDQLTHSLGIGVLYLILPCHIMQEALYTVIDRPDLRVCDRITCVLEGR